MSQFLRKMVLFGCLQLAVLAVLAWRSQAESVDEYLASPIDKHRRAQEIETPKILIVGGSNVAFGIDSPEIERRLHRPVVNLGVIASVGLEYMLNEAEALSRPGDVIVLSPEYEHFLSDMTSSAVLLRIMEHCPESRQYVDLRTLSALLDEGLPCLHKVVRRGLRVRWRRREGRSSEKEKNNPYFRDSFNVCGDVVAHHCLSSTFRPAGPRRDETSTSVVLAASSKSQVATEQFVEATINRLNEFVERCRRNQVQVCFAHPPRAAGSSVGFEKTIQQIDRRLSKRLNAPILTRMNRLILDDRHFFDTLYHLGLKGKQLRTADLVDGLERNWSKSGVPSDAQQPSAAETASHAERVSETPRQRH